MILAYLNIWHNTFLHYHHRHKFIHHKFSAARQNFQILTCDPILIWNNDKQIHSQFSYSNSRPLDISPVHCA